MGRCCVAGPGMSGPYRVAGFLLCVAMVSGHGAVKTAPYRTLESGIVGRVLTPPHKFSTAEADSFYAPALGSNNAAARYAKYSAKHIHPCPRFSLCLHSGGSNSTSAMAAQTGTS